MANASGPGNGRDDGIAASVQLTDGVRRGLEDARDRAKRNIEYITKQIATAEREIARLRLLIESHAEERTENEVALAQAETMLDV